MRELQAEQNLSLIDHHKKGKHRQSQDLDGRKRQDDG
jgi:hypothetical protein